MSRLNENVSTKLKRRLNYDSLKNDIQIIMEYELSFHDYNIGEYISEVCSWEVNNILDDMFNEHNITLQPKDKDKLYHFLVDNFGEMIAEYYKNNNNGNLKESVKKYIVTESQYKRLFEQKVSKVEMFQDLINEKLNYIKEHCDNNSSETFPNDISFSSCDSVEIIDSIKVDEVQTMTGARTDMYGNTYDATPSIYVKLTINFLGLKDSYDFDDIIYDIKHMLRKSSGLPIVLDYRINNINKIKE